MAVKNTIRINGKVYDAITGRPVVDSLSVPSQPRYSAGSVVSPSKVLSDKPEKIEVKSLKSEESKSYKIHVVRDPGVKAKTMHQKTQHSQTLMRSLVKHPSSKPKTISLSAQIKQPESILVKPTGSERLHRAAILSRSSKVSKFGSAAQFKSKTEVIPVKVAPAEREIKPIQDFTSAPPLVFSQAKKQYQSIESDIFANALKSADSRVPAKARYKKAKSLKFKLATGFAAVVLLVAFLGYHNATGMQLKGISSKAGFNAGLPKYKPTGYNIGKVIGLKDGVITLSYESLTNGGDFKLSQQKASDNAVAAVLTGANNKMSMQLPSGLTLYIINNNNAAWQKNGILYQITGTAGLSADQIQKLATSL